VRRCDGPLLGALKAGHWVLLDELNLASQSVLEGLNALLDHRAEVSPAQLLLLLLLLLNWVLSAWGAWFGCQGVTLVPCVQGCTPGRRVRQFALFCQQPHAEHSVCCIAGSAIPLAWILHQRAY